MASELKTKKRKAPAEESAPSKKAKKPEAAKPKSILKKSKASADTSVDSATKSTPSIPKPLANSSRKRALEPSDSIQHGSERRKTTTDDTAKPKKQKASTDSQDALSEPATKKVKRGKTADGASASAKSTTTTSKVSRKSEKASAPGPQTEEPRKSEPVVGNEDDDNEAEDDQTAALLAGFESSEDEDAVDDKGLAPDVTIPALPDESKTRKKLKAVSHSDSDEPGVIYVGRIPHGFYEHQMRAYFSQFGEITRLRLSRNRRTGASKHYAFIEFASSEVAQIVADTMNNYLMFGHILKVRLIPKEQVHEELFKGANKRFKVMPRNMLERQMLKRGMGRDGWEKRIGNEEKRRREKAEKLKAIGYDFEMPALKDVSEVPVKVRGATAAIEPPTRNLAGEQAVEAALAKAATLDAAANQLVTELAEESAKSAEAIIITEEQDGVVTTKIKINQTKKGKKDSKKHVKTTKVSAAAAA